MDLPASAPAPIRERLAGRPYSRETIGLSGDGVLVFDDCVLKIAPADGFSPHEAAMMTWLRGRLPVPEVLHSCVEQDRAWLLMSRLPGKMACDPYYLSRPDALLPLLATALRTLWAVDTRGCPRAFSLDDQLLLAEEHVRRGLCDPEGFDKAAFRDPAHQLAWLKDHRPPEDRVLSHGDLCLPNILLRDDGLSGFVDLGLCAVADRHRDLALCWRSLGDNTHGHYGNYPDFPSPDSLFSALGFAPDREKLRYYLLLDQLF